MIYQCSINFISLNVEEKKIKIKNDENRLKTVKKPVFKKLVFFRYSVKNQSITSIFCTCMRIAKSYMPYKFKNQKLPKNTPIKQSIFQKFIFRNAESLKKIRIRRLNFFSLIFHLAS